MRRHGLGSFVFILVVALGALAATFATGNEPLLGLDLQGGVAVVLQPTSDADDETLDQAIEIIRDRIDSLGVAEPEIARQGSAIIVQVPGVKDRERILELVGTTAELRFRPVLQRDQGLTDFEPEDVDPSSTTTVVDESTTTTVDESTTSTADTSTTSTSVSDPPTTTADETDEGLGWVEGESAAPAFQTDESTTTTTEAPPDTTATTVEGDGTTTTSTSIDPADLADLLGGEFDLTPPEADVADAEVVLARYDDEGKAVERYRLGPAMATGEIVSSAAARLEPATGTWTVELSLRGGAAGSDVFDAIALACFSGSTECPAIGSTRSGSPTGLLAMALDGRVESVTGFETSSFAGNAVISGDFTEREAKDLALVLRYGALPIELEQQQTQSVSATLGRDALRAGVISGIVGLVLVSLYMVAFYRLLGVVAILSLGVSAALLWSIISYLGDSQGLALGLAGVTGIIVSIGIAVDSNVVFYEHLKEDVSRGRTLRSAVEGSFRDAFSTILKADIASLIGAGVLFMLTVGPVRGFALFLGLSTLLDLVASYLFMRPLTVMLVRSKRLQNRPRAFGMPSASPEVSV